MLSRPAKYHECLVIDLADLGKLVTAKRKNVRQEVFGTFDDCRFNLDTSNSSLIQKMVKNSNPLGELAEFYNGIKTGDNKRFLSETKLSAKYDEVIRGRDIQKYYIEYGNGFVYFDPEKLWGNTNETKLRRKPKIVVRQTGDSIVAALDERGTLTLDTTHLIFDTEIPIKAQLAILNSRLINWYYTRLVEEKGRVFAEVKIVNLKKLPISRAALNAENQQQLIRLVDHILTAKKRYPATDTSTWEHEIDQHVYALYGLTAEDIAVVEEATRS